MRDYASLLLERGSGEYGFIHLTFQEYLAAMAVAQKGQSDLTPVVDLLAERLADPRWHEVLLLTIGYLGIVQQRDEAAGEVLQRLIERSPGEPGAAVVLAGEAVLDTWPGGVTQQCRDAIEAALLATMLDSKGLRRSPGRVQGRSSARWAIRATWRKWYPCRRVRLSWVQMGESQHKVNVAAFRIAKYPVTNQQYASLSRRRATNRRSTGAARRRRVN